MGAPESVYIDSEGVRIATLDIIMNDYIGKEKNIFLKIDVQGFEYQVLGGSKKHYPRFREWGLSYLWPCGIVVRYCSMIC